MDALEHLQHDPVFQQSLRKVAGEAAARQYRYLNELPAKRAFFTNNVTSDSFPQKEQVPFGNDEATDIATNTSNSLTLPTSMILRRKECTARCLTAVLNDTGFS
ncbi:hypothetical protein ATN88_02210 [Enterovibrio coralii]|uniref:Uncharacterized protein n=2 Tax=Enterovibrio coralii TaxID=294935 RepID=A0A135I7V1_9GAMM|nr:hypothetical protein ATN88_02210 [Enterovibrio coralii]